jgi:hypothetical protein
MVAYILYNSIYSMIIFGAGIIPFSKLNNRLLFLFGNDIAYNKWSDFGGKSEKYESYLDTAVREGYEETNGFLGSKQHIKMAIENQRYPIFKTNDDRHYCYLMKIQYSKELPHYMNNNINFIKNESPAIIDNEHNGLYEKSHVDWFTIDELKNSTEFRSYFYDIVWKLDKKYEEILNHDKKLQKKRIF